MTEAHRRDRGQSLSIAVTKRVDFAVGYGYGINAPRCHGFGGQEFDAQFEFKWQTDIGRRRRHSAPRRRGDRRDRPRPGRTGPGATRALVAFLTANAGRIGTSRSCFRSGWSPWSTTSAACRTSGSTR